MSSVSGEGVGGVRSAIETAEMRAGKEEREAPVACFAGEREEVGPLYATGLGDMDAQRKERYLPSLGTKRV